MSNIIPIIFTMLLAGILLYKFGYLSEKTKEKREAFAQQYVYTSQLNQCVSALSLLDHSQDEILSYRDELISQNPNISKEKISELRKVLTAQSYALSHIILAMVNSEIKRSGLGVNICLQRDHQELIKMSLQELYGDIAKQYDIASCNGRYVEIFYAMHKISGQKFDNYLLNA